jgi:hypothetical protein
MICYSPYQILNFENFRRVYFLYPENSLSKNTISGILMFGVRLKVETTIHRKIATSVSGMGAG